jgi:hypothetical protein
VFRELTFMSERGDSTRRVVASGPAVYGVWAASAEKVEKSRKLSEGCGAGETKKEEN